MCDLTCVDVDGDRLDLSRIRWNWLVRIGDEQDKEEQNWIGLKMFSFIGIGMEQIVNGRVQIEMSQDWCRRGQIRINLDVYCGVGIGDVE